MIEWVNHNKSKKERIKKREEEVIRYLVARKANSCKK